MAIMKVLQNGVWVDVPALVGPKGDKGDPPVKGKDYWTEADKAEIVANVLANFPEAEGGSY